MTSARTVLRVLFAFLIALGLTFTATATASAHGGPYEIEFDQDGGGGVTAFARYVEDGHIVDAIMDVTAVAHSADGRTLGPVQLVSSPEGQGLWVSPEPFLDIGVWTVTVSTTTPLEVTAEKEIEVVLAEEPPPVVETEDSTPEPSASGPDPILAIVIGAGILLLIAAIVIFAVRRTRRRRS